MLFALLFWSTTATTADGLPDPEVRVQWAEPPAPLPDFKLMDQRGRQVGVDLFRDHVAVLFFGFTHCGDVCPATLHVLRQVEREIAEPAGKFLVVFVSVDGARDTPQVLARYLEPISKSFVGLTGTSAEVRVLADKLPAVFFNGMPTPDGGYDVEHTSQVYLVDSEARLRARIYGRSADVIGSAVREVLAEKIPAASLRDRS